MEVTANIHQVDERHAMQRELGQSICDVAVYDCIISTFEYTVSNLVNSTVQDGMM